MCKRLSQTATHGDIVWTLYFVAAFLRQREQGDLDGIVGGKIVRKVLIYMDK